MIQRPFLILVFSSLIALSRIAQGQSPGGWDMHHFYEELGGAVGIASDLDGDSVPEFFVYSFNKIHVFSGATGSRVFRFLPSGKAVYSPSLAQCLDDVNGDGMDDFVFVHREDVQGKGYTIFSLSGLDGSIIRSTPVVGGSFRWLLSICSVPDQDGDGVLDFVLGGGSSYGRLGFTSLYSGVSHSLLLEIDNPGKDYNYFGRAVSPVRDIDFDGGQDLVVGAPDESTLFFFSLRTGTLLKEVSDTQLGLTADKGLNIGRFLLRVPDATGDGVPDILVGAETGAVRTGGGVLLVSGSDEALVHDFIPPSPEWDYAIGFSAGTIGDRNRDGVIDFGVPSRGQDSVGQAATVFVFSGANGDLLEEFLPFPFKGPGLNAFASGVDFDSDGRADVVLGKNVDSGRDGDALVATYSEYQSISPDTLSVGGNLPVSIDLNMPSEDAGSGYSVLLSRSDQGFTDLNGVQVPLVQDRLFDATYAGWSPPGFSGRTGLLNFRGEATARIAAIPAYRPLVGHSVFLATISFDPHTGVPIRSTASGELQIVP